MKNTFSTFLILMLGLISFRSMAQCHFYLPDPTNFNRVGNSLVTGSTFTLANDNFTAGAAWYRDSVDLNHDFDVSFSVYLCGTADGMAFVLQSCSNGLNALGGYGIDLGYYGNTN